ncbi:hypothetical protein [Paenibacillus sp. DMB5]|uniref:hypothetical protein n=1 Tax=Paenibacillus sp. DMB5 TaxID=1780103 RepID=UPI00076CD984|nr:hypothetical protein [Paenibacillus sp. DMB5]KUP22399.1 hypothetical protein AWJ19_27660 [Paenibacillus sp. DMB5]
MVNIKLKTFSLDGKPVEVESVIINISAVNGLKDYELLVDSDKHFLFDEFGNDMKFEGTDENGAVYSGDVISTYESVESGLITFRGNGALRKDGITF